MQIIFHKGVNDIKSKEGNPFYFWVTLFYFFMTIYFTKRIRKFRFSRKKVWIITLSVTFSVLFYGYSLIAMSSFTFFFFEKKKQKT